MIAARTVAGRLVDVANPPMDWNWPDEVAGPLSRIVRFAGQLPDDSFGDPNTYSVAEHSVRGADAVHAEALAVPSEPDTAAVFAFAFLLHDAHEALTGDATRPFAMLAALCGTRDGAPAGAVAAAIRAARAHIDAAMYRAAGLPWPLPGPIAAVVRDMDDRMCAAEQRRWWHRIPGNPVDPELRHCRPVDILDWREPDGLDARPWPPARARVAWMARFHAWHPAVNRTFGGT